MKKYEFRIDTYPSDNFSQLIAFCDEKGGCSMDKLPYHQIEKLTDILNDQGEQGWEVVQLVFGKDGILAVWKRQID